jgi:hypothetical protein
VKWVPGFPFPPALDPWLGFVETVHRRPSLLYSDLLAGSDVVRLGPAQGEMGFSGFFFPSPLPLLSPRCGQGSVAWICLTHVSFYALRARSHEGRLTNAYSGFCVCQESSFSFVGTNCLSEILRCIASLGGYKEVSKSVYILRSCLTSVCATSESGDDLGKIMSNAAFSCRVL